MTKEELFDDLLTSQEVKRSADDSNGLHEGQTVWHEAGGLDVEQLKIGK